MNLINKAQAFTKKNTPELLIAAGLFGMATSVIFAVKATTRVNLLIDEKKCAIAEDMDIDVEDVQLSLRETVETVWTVYVPSALAFAMSTACIVGANNVNHRRSVALATAYTLSETAFKEYKDKVIEKIGKSKEQSVRDDIAKDRLEKNKVSGNQVIITGSGDSLCYDAVSGRYFKSNIEKIRRIVNDVNSKLFIENYVTLNEFYIDLGLDTISIGSDLGWSVDKQKLEVDFGSHIADDGTPCLVMDYSVSPMF